MTNEEAIRYWIKNYQRYWSLQGCIDNYEKAKAKNFHSPHIDYCVNTLGLDRAECLKNAEEELRQDIKDAILWEDPDNWELVLDHTVTDQTSLNLDKVGDYDEYPFADHAAEEGLCEEVNWRDHKIGEDYFNFTQPFRVRIWYRKDSDYEIAFVFTSIEDDSILAISQRAD